MNNHFRTVITMALIASVIALCVLKPVVGACLVMTGIALLGVAMAGGMLFVIYTVIWLIWEEITR